MLFSFEAGSPDCHQPSFNSSFPALPPHVEEPESHILCGYLAFLGGEGSLSAGVNVMQKSDASYWLSPHNISCFHCCAPHCSSAFPPGSVSRLDRKLSLSSWGPLSLCPEQVLFWHPPRCKLWDSLVFSTAFCSQCWAAP